jgi:hypothetical protein
MAARNTFVGLAPWLGMVSIACGIAPFLGLLAPSLAIRYVPLAGPILAIVLGKISWSRGSAAGCVGFLLGVLGVIALVAALLAMGVTNEA